MLASKTVPASSKDDEARTALRPCEPRFFPAERSGFEPEMPVSRHTGLAIRRFRPLSHLSGFGGARSRGGPVDSANIVRNRPKSKVSPRSTRRHLPPISTTCRYFGAACASCTSSRPSPLVSRRRKTEIGPRNSRRETSPSWLRSIFWNQTGASLAAGGDLADAFIRE